jgi:probable HAF family extracellular repeat protein
MKLLAASTAFACFSIVLPLAAQPPKYVLVDLGLGGVAVTNGIGINNEGRVSGNSNLADLSLYRAWRTAPNAAINPATDFIPLLQGATNGQLLFYDNINSSGQVAVHNNFPTAAHAARFDPSTVPNSDPTANGSVTDLGNLGVQGNTVARGINDSGQVVGFSFAPRPPACGNPYAYRTSGPTINATTDNLGTLLPNNCGSSTGYAINNAGDVVGVSSATGAAGIEQHAFFFPAGAGQTMQDLGVLGRNPLATPSQIVSIGFGINDSGQIIGVSTIAGSNGEPINAIHAFLRDSTGPMIDLGTLGGDNSQATGINASKHVVGRATKVPGATGGLAFYGFLYMNGTMYDINDLILGSHPQVTFAYSINDSGQIAGTAGGGAGFGGGSAGPGDPTTGFAVRLDPAQLPAITSASSAMFTVGSSGSFQLTATGLPIPALSESGTLPAGVTFDASTGVLSGIPGIGTDGLYHITFTAANGAGADAVQNFTFTIVSITPIGASVPATPIDTATGTSPVTMTFDNVAQSGITSLTTANTAPALPPAFSLGNPPVYYEISTTAVFSGSITVCVTFSGPSFADPSNLRLLHFVGGIWQDVTIGTGAVNNVICGSVTSLSPFAVARSLMTSTIYATSSSCSAIRLSDRSYTDSFDSSIGVYGITNTNAQGDLAANGNVTLTDAVRVNGAISAKTATLGACINGSPGVTISDKATVTGGYQILSPIVFTAPASVSPGTSDISVTASTSLVPGSYRNIAVSGHAILTLSPGVYSLNSLVLSDQSNIVIAPSGAVVINLAGSGFSKPFNMSGRSAMNSGGIPANLRIVYGGSGNADIADQASFYGVMYAPNAIVTTTGQAAWYGALVVNTASGSDGSAFHYDRSLGR